MTAGATSVPRKGPGGRVQILALNKMNDRSEEAAAWTSDEENNSDARTSRHDRRVLAFELICHYSTVRLPVSPRCQSADTSNASARYPNFLLPSNSLDPCQASWNHGYD